MNTLAPYVRRWVSAREKRGEIKKSSAADFECRLEGLVATFGRRPLNQFGSHIIERWLEKIGHLAAATRHAYLATARVFCRWLVTEKLIRSDPSAQVANVRQPSPVPRALQECQVAQVLAVLPDARARVIVWLMVGLGLRRGEVALLQVGDYDPSAGTMLVHGKGDRERVLPVPDEARTAIEEYLAEVGVRGGPLIRSKAVPTAGITAPTIGAQVSKWMREAGVKHRPYDGVSSHAFRHTAASDVLDRCKNVRVVQELLGHASLGSTMIYLRRANLDQLRDAMEGRPYATV